jgi:hypothetical protein
MTDINPEIKPSYVLVRFAEIGSVLLDVQFENVTSLQILALAHYFEVKGKSQLVLEENERMERERETSLAVPSGKILVGR